MKGRRILAAGAAALTVICCVSGLLPKAEYKAYAGASNVTMLDDAVFDGSKNFNENWYTKGEGIGFATDGSSIEFDKTSDIGGVLVFRSQPTVTEWANEVLNVEASFTVAELVGDKTFGVYVGIPRLDYDAEDPTNTRYQGATYAYAEKGADGKYYAGVTYFGETEVVLAENILLGDDTTLHFEIGQYYDGRLTVSAGSSAEFSATASIYDSNDYNAGKSENEKVVHGIGLVGFGGRGAYTSDEDYLWVNLKHLQIVNFYESTPANFNAYETFDADYVNGEEWIVGGNAYIGGGALNFMDGGTATSIRTKHYFSNFDFGFDIVDIRREPEYDASGKKTKDSCHRFQIMFGINADGPSACYDAVDALNGPKGYTTYTIGFFPSIVDGWSTGTSLFYGDSWTSLKYVGLSDRSSSDPTESLYDLYNPVNAGRTYTVRVRMVDGQLDVYVKWSEEINFTNVLSLNIGYTPEGYVGIFCGFNNAQTVKLSVDNMRMINLDTSPEFADVGFTESGYPNTGDYVWVDQRDPNDLLGVRYSATVEADLTGAWIVTGVATALLVAGVVLFIVKKGEKRK